MQSQIRPHGDDSVTITSDAPLRKRIASPVRNRQSRIDNRQ
jgi:hypothetical protein